MKKSSDVFLCLKLPNRQWYITVHCHGEGSMFWNVKEHFHNPHVDFFSRNYLDDSPFLVFVSHIKPQHLMALTFISVHKDEDHPERCSSPMASFPSFRALCHLKRWTDNKAASSYSFFSISSLLRSCYSKFHTKFDCVTLLEAPLQEVASLFFYGPISSWWVIWLVSCQTPLHPRIFPGTNFRLHNLKFIKILALMIHCHWASMQVCQPSDLSVTPWD